MANGFGTIPSILGSVANARQIEAADQRALANQIEIAAAQARLAQSLDPQTIALQQLQRQLQTRQIQQQLADFDNPNAALVRQLQQQLAVQAINPASGIVAAPVGLEGETIFAPAALTSEQQASLPLITPTSPMTPAQAEAFPDLVRPVPTAAPGTPIQPILVGGTPTGFSQDLGRAVDVTEALSRARGTTSLDRQLLANAQAESNRLSREDIAREGVASRERIASTRSSGRGAGALSSYQIANISGKAGRAGLTQEDVNERYTTDGITDWNRLNLDANRQIQDDIEEAARLKASDLSAADEGKAKSFIAVHKDLGKLGASLKKFKASGKEPDAWERAVGTALENPPDGIWRALYQTVIGQGITPDAQDLFALKARVRSAVTRANAGLSQTEREIANVSQYSPQTNDDLEETLRLAAGLEDYLVSQVESITTDPREWLKSLQSTPRIFPPSGTPDAPAAAPAKPGKITIIAPDGRAGFWDASKPIPKGYKQSP